MALLGRNIWTLFLILLTGGLLFLCLSAYNQWENIHHKYSIAQTNQVQLVSNAAHSLFLTQEMMLSIVGNEVLKDKNARALDDLLKLNPSIIGFGLADTEGNLRYVSSNMQKSKLPNLKKHPMSKDSFALALKSDTMVLGRTYFFEPLNDWVIPMRRAIRDDEGNILAMMTAGLRIQGAFKLFTNTLHIHDENRLSLVRSQDQFMQFQSSNDLLTKEHFDTPVPSIIYEGGIQAIMKKYGLSLEEIQQSNRTYTIEIDGLDGHVHAAVKYDPRFELWTISTIKHDVLEYEFFEILITYILIFTTIMVVIYMLFRTIARAENRRRKDLIYQANHDPLTQLPNRTYLEHTIHHWISKPIKPFSIIYLDMDNFKNVNDSFGHHFGDQLLIELANRLRKFINNDSIVIRQGGDEFIILTYRINDDELLEKSKVLITEISKPYQINQFSFVIGASIGVAKYPEHGTTIDMLLRAADIAMYESKKYRNTANIFMPTMQDSYLRKLEIEQALRHAIKNDEISLVYQPLLDEKGSLYGVEVLVRWHNATLGMIPPDVFIPIAEASGLMPKLGLFILQTALKEMHQLQSLLNTTFHIALNISVKQFMEKDFAKHLFKQVSLSHLPFECITLEITESLFIEDTNYILPLLQKIRDKGIHISMDDFGTGYSSLSILRTLPIDELKIDRSFILSIQEDETAKKMIKNIISIGKNLELHVLAEGVETKAQEELLRAFGCDRFQGYYYAKPMKVDDLKIFIETSL